MSTPNHLDPERLLALRPETVHSKKRLFEQAAASISAEFGLDQESVYRSLLDREKLGSTAIGHGVAIPHSRMGGCSEPLLASLASAFSSAELRDTLRKADTAGDARLALLEGLGL